MATTEAELRNFEETVKQMEKHWQRSLTNLAENLGKGWDASDLARFASAYGRWENDVNYCRQYLGSPAGEANIASTALRYYSDKERLTP